MDGERAPFVSVKLQPIGRPRTFLLDNLRFDPPLTAGDEVVVRTDTGSCVGQVVRMPEAVAERRLPAENRQMKVLRRVTEQDVAGRLKQKHREQEAYRIALLKVRERGLEMKLTRAEQQLDGARLVFYFTADGRVDFRELVRELAAEFHTRIEMRQIGARDEAKMLGGYGSCGRPLCCTTWLQSFAPISIRMAKQQNLSLNPSKLSGQCGRLKCCLRYELPNGKGVKHGGCAHGEGSVLEGCGGCGSGGGGCGSGACGAGGCGSCGR